MDRFKSGGGLPFYYWLIAGLLIGMLIGWFFSGFISMLLRIALMLGVVIVIALAVYLWQRTKGSSSGVVANNGSDIPEGSWRNVDPASGK